MIKMMSKNEPWDLHEDFPEDVSYLQKCLKVYGYDVDRKYVQQAWKDYSNSVFVGWIYFEDTPDWCVQTILTELKPVEIIEEFPS